MYETSVTFDVTKKASSSRANMQLSIESTQFSSKDKKLSFRVVAKCPLKNPLKGRAIITLSEDYQKMIEDGDSDDEGDEDEYEEEEMENEFEYKKWYVPPKVRTFEGHVMKKSVDVNGFTDVEFDLENELKIRRGDGNILCWDVKIHVEMIDNHFGFTETAEKIIDISIDRSRYKQSVCGFHQNYNLQI